MTRTCTRCNKAKPIGDFRMKDRLHQGRVKTCRDCEAQLRRTVPDVKRRCICGTILARDNSSTSCAICSKAERDAQFGNGLPLLRIHRQIGERLARLDREVERVTSAYRSIADRPSPESYLQALTDSLDALCALAGVEPPVIEDVFAREFVELVTGERIGLVVSEGTGSLVSSEEVGGCGEVAVGPSDLSEVVV